MKQIEKKKFCIAHGEGTVNNWTCQKWFEKFYAGDFSLHNASHSGRPVKVDSDQVKISPENNQYGR